MSAPIIVIAGRDEEAFAASREIVKMQLAFYGSTPAYKPVMDLHGWGALQPELNRLSKQGGWREMGELIDDDLLEAFTVVCETPDQIVPRFRERFGGLIDTWHCTVDLADRDAQSELVATVQEPVNAEKKPR